MWAFKLFICFLLGSIALEACTGMKLKAQDGSVVNGRTLEFGVPIRLSCTVIPRGYGFTGTTPKGKGLSYTSRYGAVGMAAFDSLSLLDGMNEKGLAVGTFYFPGFADYVPYSAEVQSKALSPVDFPNWILTQFGSLDEVKTALKEVVIVPTVISGWGPTPPPFHYIVYDKSGASLVIEPADGQLKTYDNPIGVFTNAPTFDWHLTNLRNFINLRALNAPPLEIEGIEFSSFGQGSGMVGLPGDFTPPSRFVRATAISHTALPSETSEEAVFQLFHLLNQFDIPKGLVREKQGDQMAAEWTLLTGVKDPQTLKYYFKTYEDQTIRVVNLQAFDLGSKKVQKLSTVGTERTVDLSPSKFSK